MAFIFEDRMATYPNRYKVTPVNGDPSYQVILERADVPTVAGTPVNAETFNAILDEINSVLPAVATGDAGKVLKVEGGKWTAGTVGDVPVVNATSEDGLNYTATVPGFSDYNLGQMIVLIPDRACAAYDAVLNINDIGYRRIYLDCEGGYQTPAYYGWLAQNKPVLLVLSMDNTTGTQYWAALTNDAHHNVSRKWNVSRFESYSRGGGTVYIDLRGVVDQTNRTFNCSGSIRLQNVTTADPNLAVVTPSQLADLLKKDDDNVPYIHSASGTWWANITSGQDLTQYGTRMFLNTTDGLKITRLTNTSGQMAPYALSVIMNGAQGGMVYFTLYGEID